MDNGSGGLAFYYMLKKEVEESERLKLIDLMVLKLLVIEITKKDIPNSINKLETSEQFIELNKILNSYK
jgi:hypothetical protein